MKLWFMGMSGPGSLENLKELFDPIHHLFDGIVWVLHDSVGSPEEAYLNTVKGFGRVIHTPFVQRFDFSRNHYLYCGPQTNGDWCIQCDDLERVPVEFARDLPTFVSQLQSANVNMAFYYGKAFVYEYHESLAFTGVTHETLMRQDGQARSVELSSYYPDETKVRKNVRPEKRDIPHPFAWVSHYLAYWVCPWGARSALLGLDTYGDPAKLFPAREQQRLAFREEVLRRGHPMTVAGVKALFSGPLDPTLKTYINTELVLNNYYRYAILGDKTVVHSHNPKDIVPIS